jgi:hypothetical protein
LNTDKAVATVSTARGLKTPETDGQLQWIKQIAVGQSGLDLTRILIAS